MIVSMGFLQSHWSYSFIFGDLVPHVCFLNGENPAGGDRGEISSCHAEQGMVQEEEAGRSVGLTARSLADARVDGRLLPGGFWRRRRRRLAGQRRRQVPVMRRRRRRRRGAAV